MSSLADSRPLHFHLFSDFIRIIGMESSLSAEKSDSVCFALTPPWKQTEAEERVNGVVSP